MFVLPNLFTLSSVFCGLLAITKAIEGGNANLQTACLSISLGLFFDMADGRVARLTKTQSDFGVQIDSLADTITFGVAPAIVAWAWGYQVSKVSVSLRCLRSLAVASFDWRASM